jgi:tetratricopeptide (TPR) repeat protein
VGGAVTAVAESRAPAPSAARLGGALPFLPAAAVAAVWLVWAVRDGGYFATAWYPAGLLAAGLLLTLAIARPAGSFARSPATVPLLLLAGWTAWNALSLVWSDGPGAGREETNKLLTVVLMGAVMAATPWRPRSATALLGVWAAVIAAVAAIDLTAFALDDRPQDWLLQSRYLGPLGYANGSAAVGAIAFWPLLAVAARPATPEPLRVLALPTATLALLWSLLPQSRATILAALAVVVLFLALSPHRWRVLARLAIVGGALLLCAPSLFDVYSAAAEARPLAGVVDEAAIRVAVATALALAASFALVGIENRVRPSARTLARLRRAALATGAAAVVAALAVAAVESGRIADSLERRWETFASDASVENTQTGARLGQVTADKRYDYWTVALRAFEDRPLAGVGAGGFEVSYTREKDYAKHSRYAHNVWLRALSETGIVGLALLAAALLAGLVAFVRARLRGPSDAHAALAAAAALATAFFLQCGLDWLEEVPALLAPAVGLPLAVLRATAAGDASPARRRTLPAIALAVVAVAALVPPYVAVRQLERGDELRARDPQAALAAYDRAASADPLALTPHLRRGFLALRLGDTALARRAFEDALDVQEHWVPHFELGLLDAQAGRFAAAEQRLSRAAALNRSELLVTDALAAVRDRRRLDPLEVNRQVLEDPVLAAP